MERETESKSQDALSSSSKNNNKQNEKDEVDDGKEDKKLKMELETEPEEEFAVDETCINNLPPEMLMKILSNLKIKDLSACRLVNRKWNELVIENIKLRTDAEISISCFKIEIPSYYYERRNLGNFLKCFGPPKKFPFSCFRCYVDSSTFESDDWMKFLYNYEDNIKCLRLISYDEDLVKLAKSLGYLLLNQLPKLQEFGLDLNGRETSNSSTVQLFPNLNSNPTKTKNPVQLPHLKIIYLNQSTFSKHVGVVTDLLGAAVNLEKLVVGRFYSTEELHLLQSLGKLHCVQDLEIDLSAQFFSEQTNNDKSQRPLVFQSKQVNLYMVAVYRDQSIWSTAASFLSNLFETSKDTLKELNTEALGFLHQLRLPKFTKLFKMRIFDRHFPIDLERYFTRVRGPIFPAGIKLENTFPLLNSLEVDIPWTTAFSPEDCISTLPALETLKIVNCSNMISNSIVQISFMCPNLKHFEISDSNDEFPMDNFPGVGTAIWTHLKKLQSLKLEIQVGTSFNAFPAVDSTFTGFSKEDVVRLYDLIKTEESVENQGSQIMIFLSKLEAERKNPSILDLKDLIKLQVSCSRYGYEEYIKKTMLVSEKCAFKLMENLTYEIK